MASVAVQTDQHITSTSFLRANEYEHQSQSQHIVSIPHRRRVVMAAPIQSSIIDCWTGSIHKCLTSAKPKSNPTGKPWSTSLWVCFMPIDLCESSKGGCEDLLHRLISEKLSLHFAVHVQRLARHIIEWKTRATWQHTNPLTRL